MRHWSCCTLQSVCLHTKPQQPSTTVAYRIGNSRYVVLTPYRINTQIAFARRSQKKTSLSSVRSMQIMNYRARTNLVTLSQPRLASQPRQQLAWTPCLQMIFAPRVMQSRPAEVVFLHSPVTVHSVVDQALAGQLSEFCGDPFGLPAMCRWQPQAIAQA